MVMTMDYVTSTSTATIWLRQDVVDEVASDSQWAVGLCRTDTWRLLSNTVEPANEVVKPLGTWSTPELKG